MSDARPSGPPAAPRRAIRSFVKRGGRITPAQERALVDRWPSYGLDYSGRALDLAEAFGRRAPVTMEIGFGDGELLVALAQAHPERNFLGVEVHGPGVGHCLIAATAAQLANLRLVRHDAVELLSQAIAPAALDAVLVLFADPWPKKRHHKRRLVQPEFVELLASRLAPGGQLRLATDWEPYAVWMLETVSGNPQFRNRAPGGGFLAARTDRAVTKFERRGARLGHRVYDLEFERLSR